MIVALLSLALGTVAGALWMSSKSRGAHEAALQEKASLAAALEAERRASAEKVALLQTAEVKLRDAFSALSSEAFIAAERWCMRVGVPGVGGLGLG